MYASRIILAARSEPFRAMLFGSGGPGGRFKEASSGGAGEGIVVEDVSHAAFVAMLEFLYTDGVADMAPELAVPLLIAGERWMLPRLKALCEETIRRGITTTSVVPTLLAAHRHRAAGLKVWPCLRHRPLDSNRPSLTSLSLFFIVACARPGVG